MPQNLVKPNSEVGYIEAEAERVADLLVDGDGLMWPGDPTLSLHMGFIKMTQRAWVDKLGRYADKGEIIARTYEVWRHCEDGVDRIIGRWNPDVLGRIIPDLASMRLDSPGHVSTIDQIDTHNNALEAAAKEERKQALAEMREHGTKLMHDLTEGRSTFRQFPGQRDEPKPAEVTQDARVTPVDPAG